MPWYQTELENIFVSICNQNDPCTIEEFERKVNLQKWALISCKSLKRTAQNCNVEPLVFLFMHQRKPLMLNNLHTYLAPLNHDSDNKLLFHLMTTVQLVALSYKIYRKKHYMKCKIHWYIMDILILRRARKGTLLKFQKLEVEDYVNPPWNTKQTREIFQSKLVSLYFHVILKRGVIHTNDATQIYEKRF